MHGQLRSFLQLVEKALVTSENRGRHGQRRCTAVSLADGDELVQCSLDLGRRNAEPLRDLRQAVHGLDRAARLHEVAEDVHGPTKASLPRARGPPRQLPPTAVRIRAAAGAARTEPRTAGPWPAGRNRLGSGAGPPRPAWSSSRGHAEA